MILLIVLCRRQQDWFIFVTWWSTDTDLRWYQDHVVVDLIFLHLSGMNKETALLQWQSYQVQLKDQFCFITLEVEEIKIQKVFGDVYTIVEAGNKFKTMNLAEFNRLSSEWNDRSWKLMNKRPNGRITKRQLVQGPSPWETPYRETAQRDK